MLSMTKQVVLNMDCKHILYISGYYKLLWHGNAVNVGGVYSAHCVYLVNVNFLISFS